MRTSLSIMTSILVILVIGSISAFLLIIDEKLLVENKKQDQSVLFEHFVKVSEDAMVLGDALLLSDFCSMLKQINPSISYIVFTDPMGIIISSGTDEMIYFATNKLGRKGVKTPKGYLLREVKGPGGDEIVDFSMEIKSDNRFLGTAQIGFSTTILKQELASVIRNLRRTLFYVALIAIGLGIIGSLIFAARMMRPVKLLADGAARIGSGEFNYRIVTPAQDELGWLAGEFNRMAEKLSELDQMKNDFVSNVTHELRSPLGAIKSYVDATIKQINLSPVVQDYCNRIQSNVARLSAFIDNLLDVAKIEQGKVDLTIHSIAIHVLVQEVIKNFEAQAKDKQIHLESHIVSVLPPAAADKGKIEQVFTNLISNALKFTPRGGSIVIDAQEIQKGRAPHSQDRLIRISVADTGHGIPAGDLKRIFEKFEQVKTSDASDAHGTGLGLAIVKGIIDKHNGNIWVQSRVGKGTTFFFTLPVASSNESIRI